ncbi:MAG TPA: heme o synthase [Methylomirabilota bacterium]|jgi:protoheme IX farnesyltransferase|nr:heme o synthase [Methylomirabilota bacterium]
MSLANELPVSRAATFSAWLELTKPRIVSLVIFTGLPALLLAAHGWPAAPVAWGTLGGIALSAASAASFNHYFDRDIDALMRRTRSRPLPSGALPPAAAVALGVVLGVLAMVLLGATTNLLAAGLAFASILYYALFYTVWLKRRTPMNIVIGGGAGASAPLIAWAAVTDRVGVPAILLASIIFLWTPPHFWALSLYRRDDYERAGLPMLPVTHGEPETRRQILLYTIVLVASTLAVAPLAGLGPLYTASAAILGVLFVLGAERLRRVPSVPHAQQLFRYSIAYLFVLFLVMSVDALITVARARS